VVVELGGEEAAERRRARRHGAGGGSLAHDRLMVGKRWAWLCGCGPRPRLPAPHPLTGRPPSLHALRRPKTWGVPAHGRHGKRWWGDRWLGWLVGREYNKH
jgi:hypothetical protein